MRQMKDRDKIIVSYGTMTWGIIDADDLVNHPTYDRICDASDPKWREIVGRRMGIKIPEPVINPISSDAGFKVKPLE